MKTEKRKQIIAEAFNIKPSETEDIFEYFDSEAGTWIRCYEEGWYISFKTSGGKSSAVGPISNDVVDIPFDSAENIKKFLSGFPRFNVKTKSLYITDWAYVDGKESAPEIPNGIVIDSEDFYVKLHFDGVQITIGDEIANLNATQTKKLREFLNSRENI